MPQATSYASYCETNKLGKQLNGSHWGSSPALTMKWPAPAVNMPLIGDCHAVTSSTCNLTGMQCSFSVAVSAGLTIPREELQELTHMALELAINSHPTSALQCSLAKGIIKHDWLLSSNLWGLYRCEVCLLEARLLGFKLFNAMLKGNLMSIDIDLTQTYPFARKICIDIPHAFLWSICASQNRFGSTRVFSISILYVAINLPFRVASYCQHISSFGQ